jgi:hypothetical protein
MHTLEFVRDEFATRIEQETGNLELASAAKRLASASHWYVPESLQWAEQWRGQGRR